MARKRFDQVVPVDVSRIRAPHKKAAVSEKSRDLTIPGLIALVGIVLITALYLNDEGTIAQQASDNPSIRSSLAGGASSSPFAADTTVAKDCQASSYCDGSKLIRQHTDCTRLVAYCDYGCAQRSDGAVCR